MANSVIIRTSLIVEFVDYKHFTLIANLHTKRQHHVFIT